MALVTATVTVDFIANYAGPHRVCWRIQGSGDPYDCSTTVNCVGGATLCQAIFNPIVNTTSCDGTVVFEGYIQALCEDILAVSGRLPFTANFIPNVICNRNEVLCARGGIDTVIAAPAGQQYLVADPLTIVRNGADPEVLDGTISIATVGTGVINSVTSVLVGGVGYAIGDLIDIVDPFGGGADLIVTAETGGVIDLGGVAVNSGGSQYTGPLAFVTATGGGSGANFDIVDGVDYDVFGSILTVTVSVPGLYSIPPTVTITTGAGAGAQLVVALTPCPIYPLIGLDCVGDPVSIADAALQVGETFATCIDGVVTAPPSEYDVTEIGCCIPEDSTSTVCTDHHIINNTGGPIDVHITNCDGDDEIISAPGLVPNDTTAVCLIAGGYVDPNVAGLTIVDTGTPCPVVI